MEYKLIPLHESKLLSQFVFSIYELKTGTQGCVYNTVPNGIIGLSIILKGSAFINQNGKWNKTPTADIFGLIKKPHQIKTSPLFHEIAIGFNPYFLQLFHRVNMSDLAGGNTIDAYDVFDRDNVDQFIELLHSARSEHQILIATEIFLENQLIPERSNHRLRTTIELILTDRIQKVEELAKKMNVSTSTLRNLFHENVGLSPKEFIKIKRINDILNYKLDTSEDLTILCYHLGYFDQAHFIHDFKNVIGISPGNYFKSEQLVLDFYNYGRWLSSNFDAIVNKGIIV